VFLRSHHFATDKLIGGDLHIRHEEGGCTVASPTISERMSSAATPSASHQKKTVCPLLYITIYRLSFSNPELNILIYAVENHEQKAREWHGSHQ